MTTPKKTKNKKPSNHPKPKSKQRKQSPTQQARKSKPSRPSHSRVKSSRQHTQGSPWMADSIDELPLSNTTLRFTPYAWAKLVYFCHAGDTEIGGFGLSDPDDPLLVTDLLTLKQATTSVSVDFDDEAVADLFEQQVDLGRRPEQFARIWCHTHPGSSPNPSSVDEETFAEVFGRCDWAVMFILAKGGQTYARLRFNTGPGGEMLIGVGIDYHQPFGGSDQAVWADDFKQHVHPEAAELLGGTHGLWPDAEGDLWDPLHDLIDPEQFSGNLPGDELDLEHHDQIEQLMAAYGVDDLDDLHAMLELESNTSYDDEVIL